MAQRGSFGQGDTPSWGGWNPCLVKVKDVCSFKESNDRPSVQFSSVAQSCPTLCNPMNRSTPGLAVHHQLLEFPKLMSIKSVMPSSHLILCCPLLLPPIPPGIRVFSTESSLRMRWPKYWSFSFSISPSMNPQD